MGDAIFISYRRQDAAASAGRLYDSLTTYFGPDRVFMDVSTIRGGEDFVKCIEDTLDEAGACLIIIGKEWATVADKAGRQRLDTPDDFVRKEVEMALDTGLPAIPVLVDGAMMPPEEALPETLKKLARLNALSIHHDHWDNDVQRLTKVLEIDISGSAAEKKFQRLRTLVFLFFVAAIILPILHTQIFGLTSPEPEAASYWAWHGLRYLIWFMLVGAMILLAGLFQFIERSHTVGFWISLILAGVSLFLSEKGLEIWAIVPLAIILVLMNTFTFKPR